MEKTASSHLKRVESRSNYILKARIVIQHGGNENIRGVRDF